MGKELIVLSVVSFLLALIIQVFRTRTSKANRNDTLMWIVKFKKSKGCTKFMQVIYADSFNKCCTYLELPDGRSLQLHSTSILKGVELEKWYDIDEYLKKKVK